MSRASFVEVAMRQWRIVTTLIGVSVLFGIAAFLTMPRQEFPDFTIRQGLVVGVMPGASSEEVEQRLTKPVESYLFGFKEVNKKKTRSISQEGRAVIFVELNDRVQGPEAPAFWAKLRHGLNELKSQKLPSQVVALVGNNDFGDTSALLFTLVSEEHSPRDLEKHLEVLESHLRRLDATSKVNRLGMQREVIRVSIDRERLARYGLRPVTVWASLQGMADAPVPARLDSDTLELPVHVGQPLRTEQELGELLVLSEPLGSSVRLKDVANIVREYGHEDSFIRYNGKTALVLSVEMQRGYDITHFGQEVTEAVEQAKRKLPPTVQIDRIADQSEVVQHSINHFLRDFGLAIGSVILVTMLLLPLRVASIAAVTIPISVFMTLGLLNLCGVELQTVSLAGLIVVLGMVVDNAIVVIDDHLERLDSGVDAWTAAWKSARALVIPVFTATLAIIMAYVPLSIFLNGTAKDFASSLPITIAIALGVSLVLAVTLVPILNARFIRTGLVHGKREGKSSLLERAQGAYDGALEFSFKHPLFTLAVGALSIGAALVLARSTPQQLFPKMDRNQLAVEIYLPPGRSLDSTDAVAHELETALLRDPRVVSVTAFVGASSPRFHALYAPNIPSRNYAQLLVNTTDDEATLQILKEYEARYQGAFPDAWVRWKQLDMQSSKAPIEIRLSGDDVVTLKETASRVEEIARNTSGATWVRNDFEEPLQVIEVLPDIDSANRLGISRASLQMSLAMGTARGVPLVTLWEGDYPVNVLFAEEQAGPMGTLDLQQKYVTSSLALSTVPLDQVATLQPKWVEGAIARRNGVRTLTVLVDVGYGVLASDVQRSLKRSLSDLGPLPDVELEYGGEAESTAANYVPMAISLGASVVSIYLILLFQFQRHRKAALVMLTMPLSLFGSILGLVVTGYPFGFTAFLGVISLMGIVVRNGIILVGYADELQAEGLGVREAALAAGKRRMRPIFLTSTAAAVGVVPMILSGSNLWGPLGAVTAFGLILSMLLTLFVLPVAYWFVMRRASPSEPPRGPSLMHPVASVVSGVSLVIACSLWSTPAFAQEAPLSLERALRMAVQGNAEVQRGALEVEAAQSVKSAARTQYFPKVSAVAAGGMALSPLLSLTTPGGNLPVYDGQPANLGSASQFAYLPESSIEGGGRFLVAAITAIQPLYVGGRISNGNRLAEIGIEVARSRAQLTEREALVRAEEKYWQLSALAEKESTLSAYEALLEELERRAVDAVERGLSTKNELLKVRLQRKSVEIDRKRLESGRRLAAQDLRQFLGLPSGDELALTDELSRPQDPSGLRRDPEARADQRIELQMLKKGAEATQLQSEMKKGAALPSVSIGATAYHYRLSELTNSTNAMAFAVVNLPISAWWEHAHEQNEQEARERIDESRINEVRSQLGLQIRKAWDELSISYDAVEVADAAVEQASLHLEEEKSRYQNGLTPLSEVLEAEVLRHQAEERRIDGWRDYWTKRAVYQRLVGAVAR